MRIKNNRKVVAQKWQCVALKVKGYYYALLQMKSEGRGKSRAVLTGILNYRSKVLPSLSVFEEREWMRLHFGLWNGESLILWCLIQKGVEEKHFINIGTVSEKPNDPVESPRIWNWGGLIELLEVVGAIPARTDRRRT